MKNITSVLLMMFGANMVFASDYCFVKSNDGTVGKVIVIQNKTLNLVSYSDVGNGRIFGIKTVAGVLTIESYLEQGSNDGFAATIIISKNTVELKENSRVLASNRRISCKK